MNFEPCKHHSLGYVAMLIRQKKVEGTLVHSCIKDERIGSHTVLLNDFYTSSPDDSIALFIFIYMI